VTLLPGILGIEAQMSAYLGGVISDRIVDDAGLFARASKAFWASQNRACHA